ncbi:MAG: hypothetical protein ACXWID_19350 [Pyrinomonadaceae bacterium]
MNRLDIFEGSEKFARQHLLEVNQLLGSIFEPSAERIGTNDLKRFDAMDIV